MGSINCIILDDEPFAVQLLKDYALKISALNLIYSGGDAYKVVDLLKTQSVDLIFIDLQMPELSGMAIMKMFDSRHNFIITSAYQKYALDAFQFNVVDFLLKPITFQRFHQAFQKYLHWKETFAPEPEKDHFFVKSDRKQYRIALDSILYIEGLKDYIRIHTTDSKLVVYDNMKDILKKLPKEEFIRIHRSYIIPLKKIRIVEGNRIQLQDSEYLPIGETYRKKLQDFFG